MLASEFDSSRKMYSFVNSLLFLQCLEALANNFAPLCLLGFHGKISNNFHRVDFSQLQLLNFKAIC